jgi:methyl-accepting chemotaxis protein
MSSFRWSAEHDVYLPEIDAEHRGLFKAGLYLQRALTSGAGPERLKESWHSLWQLVDAHFLHEERLMQDSGFESYEWHRKQHNTARKKIAGIDAADRKKATEALGFLANWLRDHTSVADRIMAAHVRNWTRRKAA